MNSLQNIYRDKRVLVTGNTGFKGSWLTVWLLELGAKVFGLSKDIPTTPSLFETLDLRSRVEHHEADVRDAEMLVELVSEIKPDFIFHLAAQPIVGIGFEDPLETLSTNVLGTAHVLEALRKNDRPCCAVMITSDKCYNNLEWVWGYRETDALGGKDPYSASKGSAELVIRTYYHSFFQDSQSKVRLAAARAGNVIGGGDWALHRIVPDCVKAWAEEKAATIRRPQATRPWQHVLEPLSGYLRLGQILQQSPARSGEAYNFGPPSGQVNSVLELLQELSLNWESPRQGPWFEVTENRSFHEAGLLSLNCDKALHELDWYSTLDFSETATLTAQWYHHFVHSTADLYTYTVEQLQEYIQRAAAQGKSWIG